MPDREKDGGGVTVSMAASACVSAFVAVKPLDIFTETSRKFPAVCGNKAQMCLMGNQDICNRICGDDTGGFFLRDLVTSPAVLAVTKKQVF